MGISGHVVCHKLSELPSNIADRTHGENQITYTMPGRRVNYSRYAYIRETCDWLQVKTNVIRLDGAILILLGPWRP